MTTRGGIGREQRIERVARGSTQLVQRVSHPRGDTAKAQMPREKLRHRFLVRRIEHRRGRSAPASGRDPQAEHGKLLVAYRLEREAAQRDRIE